MAVLRAADNPFAASACIERMTRLLEAAVRGGSADINSAALCKRFTDVYFGLERVLDGMEGKLVLQQRLTEIAPHAAEPGVDELSKSVWSHAKRMQRRQAERWGPGWPPRVPNRLGAQPGGVQSL